MMKILSATDTGLHRLSNQDVCGGNVLENGLAYALVCDGMGGRNGGAVASATALEQICHMLDQGLRPNMESRSLTGLLESAMAKANLLIYQKAQSNSLLQGMGTTVVMAVIEEGLAYLCHAGDSRAYLIRGQEAILLTRDHTVVQMRLERGEITPAEALVHPERHYITRAVGVADRVQPEFGEIRLEEDDLLLLCSDGLYNMVDPAELPDLCRQAAQEDGTGCLIDRANEMGGMDNITAVVLLDDNDWH